MLIHSSRPLFSLALTIGMGLAGPVGLIHGAVPARARSQKGVALQLARRNRHIDVVVTGLGDTARVVTQRGEGSMWTGRLRGGSDAVLSSGTRRMSIPGVGWASIEPVAVGRGFQLVVKGPLGSTLPVPKISSNAGDLTLHFLGVLADSSPRQISRLDLRRPGRVPQSSYVPLLRPRAVAPPLGDMAVGTMVLQNRSYVNVSGPPVTLSLNNAPAKDALMSLARLGGYGFVFVGGDGSATSAGGGFGTTVTMAFADQTYGRALNSVLLASGLQAKLDGRTLMVGEAVSGKTLGTQMSKVYRLNQASAGSAADYLASLGAQINKVSIVGATTGGGAGAGSGGGGGGSDMGEVATFTDVETYGASTGPLRGLTGTTDSRLATITLIGDSQLISVAEGYLRQIDLRKRQVAVKVQILSVSLANDQAVDTSFSSQIGDTLIVSLDGAAYMDFDQDRSDSSDSFYAYLSAAIASSNAKTLAQPTLLVQEGEEAKVKTGESVITGVSKTTNDNGETTSSNTRENAGLTLGLKVSKIDDNGFITMNVKPEIGVPVAAGTQEGVPIFNISGRELDSGSIRLRDRQTLILAGVIQDSNLQSVIKWPILGDLPLLGQFFRSNSSSRGKNELVIIVTPTVLDDKDGGSYGYGYRPSSREARQVMGPS